MSYSYIPKNTKVQPNPNFTPPPSKIEMFEKAKSIVSKSDSSEGWISVKDGLPNIKQMCLLYTPCDGFMCIGFYDGNDNWQKRHKWKLITAMRSTQTLIKTVTHWMSLPEPPKEN